MLFANIAGGLHFCGSPFVFLWSFRDSGFPLYLDHGSDCSKRIPMSMEWFEDNTAMQP